MKIGHYVNRLLDLNWVKKGEEDLSLVQSYQKDTPIDFFQRVRIDKNNFTLETNFGEIYPVALSNNAPDGNFIVLEKWENPYWKSASRFYYPSNQNPIGNYLIILGNCNTGEKVCQGIHQWPGFGFAENNFKKGLISNNGCTRVRPSDMRNIFEDITLGSLVLFE